MSSSPIERAQERLPLFPTPPVSATALADSHRRWFKRALPRSLWGRSLLIIVLPMVMLEVLATWFFYDRVWDTVVRRLSAGVAGDIGFTLNTLTTADSGAERDYLLARSGDVTELIYAFREGERLPAGLQRTTGGGTEDQLAQAMTERVGRPFEIDGDFDPRDLLVSVEMPDGVMQIAVPRKRLSTPTSSLFVLWMIGSSLVLLTIASVFMRNQVRSLQRLAIAADLLGKGRDVPNFKPEGATEVRQAARAFIKMRDRLQRQITQRTEMLAGVSHDLRTPLTRMKLALELMPEDESVAELKSDVAAMQRMVQGYLDFARGEGEENERDTDIVLMIHELISSRSATGRRSSPPCPSVTCCRCGPMRRGAASAISSATRGATASMSGSPASPCATASTSSSTMTGRAFRPSSARASSVPSTASMRRATPTPAALASASPSPATWPAARAAM